MFVVVPNEQFIVVLKKLFMLKKIFSFFEKFEHRELEDVVYAQTAIPLTHSI